MVRRKTRRFSKRLMILSSVALIVVAALIFLMVFNNNSPDDKTGTTADGKKVNLNDATKEERDQADANKETIVKRDEQANSPPSSSSQLKQVNVVITEATSTGVRAYVSGVFEDGGTCNASATKGAQTVSKASAGFQNVSYTQCAPISWTLSPGTWTITVSYKSAAAQGTRTTTLEVKQ